MILATVHFTSSEDYSDLDPGNHTFTVVAFVVVNGNNCNI